MGEAPAPSVPAEETTPISPCIGICLMDPARRLCRGCWRTIDEIAGWYGFSPTEKRAIITAIAGRRVADERAR